MSVAGLFREWLDSDRSKALAHASLAAREILRVPDHGDEPLIDVRKAAIVGAGNMGAAIAMAYANAGIPVLLKDASQDLLDKGWQKIRSTYERSLKKGHLSQDSVRRCLGLIKPVLTYSEFSEADLVLEAVHEELPLKKQVFGELSAVCRPGTILATNTSSLDIDQIASAASEPSRVVGHHFFAPANVMPLLEIVRGRATSLRILASSVALAAKLKKKGVVVGNCRGFAGNRMYFPYQREAQFLVEEGAEVQAVDAALRNFGMAMGPFATRDLSGLDVAWRIKDSEATGAVRRPLVLDRLCQMGRFGQKTGAGWYRYPEGSRKPVPDPEVQKIIEECARDAGIQRRVISSAEILERTLYALINEGAGILEEGIVRKAAALDVIFITGYGFPAYKGGPMWFADHVGLKHLCERLHEFEERHGSHWAPAPLLKRLAVQGKSISEL